MTTSSEKAIVDSRYYEEAESWDSSLNRSIRNSRNVWRIVAVLLGLAVIATIGLIWALLPLKSFEVVTLLVDKTTGFIEVARPLERGGPLTQKEALTRANVVRFLRARETYDPKGLRDNFDLASLYSTGAAASDLEHDFDPANSRNLMKLYGPNTTVSVLVKSVIFLNDKTAAVRFQTVRKSVNADPVTDNWVANVRFRYTSEPLKNDYRFDNPLGFQVFEYRRDQETVTTNDTGAGN